MRIADLHVAMLRTNVSAPVGVLNASPGGAQREGKVLLGSEVNADKENREFLHRLFPPQDCYTTEPAATQRS